jgi:16S rRNA (cytosine967-C5)-methyltransferase
VAPAVSLVNAVLRRVARLRSGDGPLAAGEDRVAWDRDELPWHDGRVLRLTEPVFSLDPLDRLGEQTSHPRALLESWTGRFGTRQASELAAHDLVHPPILVTGADVPAGCAPHEEPGFAVFPGGRSELEEMLDRCPGTWAQDPASARAVLATADLDPRLIVEVCAGKGTQTRQLAALHPQATIVASDTNHDRLETLRRSIRNDRVRVAESHELIEFAGRADLVVVDAPCSNTAVLARRVEARYRFGPESLRQLSDMQRQILADALRLPSPAGYLLYSTCSLEQEENQGQREWLSRWHGLRLIREGQCLPRGRPGDPPARYRDGAYHAILQRR